MLGFIVDAAADWYKAVRYEFGGKETDAVLGIRLITAEAALRALKKQWPVTTQDYGIDQATRLINTGLKNATMGVAVLISAFPFLGSAAAQAQSVRTSLAAHGGKLSFYKQHTDQARAAGYDAITLPDLRKHVLGILEDAISAERAAIAATQDNSLLRYFAHTMSEDMKWIFNATFGFVWNNVFKPTFAWMEQMIKLTILAGAGVGVVWVWRRKK